MNRPHRTSALQKVKYRINITNSFLQSSQSSGLVTLMTQKEIPSRTTSHLPKLVTLHSGGQEGGWGGGHPMASTKMTYREGDLFTGALGDLLKVLTLNSPPLPWLKSIWKSPKKTKKQKTNQKTIGDNPKPQIL